MIDLVKIWLPFRDDESKHFKNARAKKKKSGTMTDEISNPPVKYKQQQQTPLPLVSC